MPGAAVNIVGRENKIVSQACRHKMLYAVILKKCRRKNLCIWFFTNRQYPVMLSSFFWFLLLMKEKKYGYKFHHCKEF